MTKVTIYVEQFPNTDIRDFHVSVPVTRKIWNRYPDNKIPKAVKILERRLSALPQTSELGTMNRVGRKSIRIELNKAFSWDEVIEAVVDVLRKFYEKYYKITNFEVKIQEREAWMDRPLRDDDIY